MSYTSPSAHVTELIRRAQSGEVSAEHELYGLLQPMLRSAVTRYRHDRELYEELVGQVYMIFHRLIMKYDLGRGVNPFVYLKSTLPASVVSFARQYRIVTSRELSASSLNGPRSDPEQFDAEEAFGEERSALHASPSGPADVEERVIIRCRVREAVRGLPESQQRLFRYWRTGSSCETIAAELGMTVDACYKACQRMRRNLAEAL